MLRVYSCLAEEHDPLLVLLAVVVCALGTFGTASLLEQARQHHARPTPIGGAGRAQLLRLLACAAATGTAIWATHFIAMLAYQPRLQVGYQLGLTLGSLLLEIAVTGAGCAIAAGAGTGRARLAAGGLVIGLGIGSMHFTSMAAFQVAGHLVWQPEFVAAAWALGLGFGAAAMLAFRLGATARRLAVPLLLILAIAGLHFTAMAAASILPDPTLALAGGIASSWLLAVLVAQAALVLLAIAVAGLIMERRHRRRGEAELARMQALADAAIEGLVVTDQGRIIAANTSFLRLLGEPPPEVEGQALANFLTETPAPPDAASVETGLVLPDGRTRPVELVQRPIRFHGRDCQVSAVRDLTARREAEGRIAFLAHHDALTGAPNRAAFNEALERELALARRYKRRTAVLLIDLDRFKLVNDSLGHAMGDALLVRVFERLKGSLRESDMAARLGGDEFAVLQPLAGQPQSSAPQSSAPQSSAPQSSAPQSSAPQFSAPQSSARLAERIIELLGRPFLLNGHVLNIGASVGIAIAPDDAATADALLKNADLALYRAKADGRGCLRMFEGGMGRAVQARRMLELDLRRAAASGEFELHYQPLLDLRQGTVLGFEALLRWHHPERGLVPPDAFIPLAEETGLIAPIGDWVLKTACRDAAGWPGAYTVAVNLSPAQFRDGNLVESVGSAMQAAGLPPSRLELEITESVLLADNSATLEALHKLRRLGVRIAMDDFGTGYSSLSYLRSFPFDKIKIDRSFVRDLEGNAESAAIVRAILGLGRTLGLATTAEGVETESQLDYIRAQGCDQAQGYLVSRPLAPAQMAAFLAERKPSLAA